ncbi:MAG: universal stress protein [Tunicatimonas sp.]
MKPFNRWMVGLDFTATDDSLIEYVACLAHVLPPQKIYFVHVLTSFEVPEEMKRYLPGGKGPTRESIRRQLEARVRPHFDAEETTVVCEVYEGATNFELWREAYRHDIDLFIAGSKPIGHGRGLLPQKFVRKSTCSVCFVPEHDVHPLRKIIVPTDFSEYAAKALNTAITIAQQQADCQLVCLHVYELPHAYYYNQFPRQQYAELMERKAHNEYEQWIDNIDTKGMSIEPVFRLLEHPYVVDHLLKEAKAQPVDLIVMGAGGHSLLSRIFLGSHVERMVGMEKSIPLMIVKDKARDIGIMEIFTT